VIREFLTLNPAFKLDHRAELNAFGGQNGWCILREVSSDLQDQ
jgi:hypothetical protein